MRALWSLVRIALLVIALGVTFVTPVFIGSPSGTTIDPVGAVIALVALGVVVFSAWSLWRDRGALF